jgi:transcriptional regulator with XRE-family HTH domain
MVRPMEFSEALRALMDERGLSQRGLASRIPCDRSLICRLCSGKQRPSVRIAQCCDQILGAEGELVALSKKPSRRAVLAGGLLAGSLLAVTPETAERLAWAQRHPPQVDAAAVESLTDLLAAARHADDTAGSSVMLRPVLAQLASVETMVTQAGGPVRPALVHAAEQWAQFAGWLCRNTADWVGAQARHTQTLEWAAELCDRTMIATTLAAKSETAAYAGQPAAAIALAQAAQRDTRAATGQRALAAEFEARSYAMTGDAAAAERKQGEAQELAAAFAARPTDRRPWSYWMTPAFFQHEAGITCSHLASDPRWHARAVTLLEPAADDKGAWASANNLTFMTFAHAQAGDVDHACAAGLQASAAVRAGGSVRNAAILAQIHADLAARYPGNARVKELAEALT